MEKNPPIIIVQSDKDGSILSWLELGLGEWPYFSYGRDNFLLSGRVGDERFHGRSVHGFFGDVYGGRAEPPYGKLYHFDKEGNQIFAGVISVRVEQPIFFSR